MATIPTTNKVEFGLPGSIGGAFIGQWERPFHPYARSVLSGEVRYLRRRPSNDEMEGMLISGVGKLLITSWSVDYNNLEISGKAYIVQGAEDGN